MTTRHRPLREGLIVGFLAYAAVALFYSTFDLLAARGALFTVDMLGRAVIQGLRDPGVLLFPHQLDLMAVFLYNALHLMVSLSIGVIVTELLAQAEQHPRQAPAILGAIAVGGVLTVLAVGEMTREMRPVLPWWSIVAANALAVVVAGTYLTRRHGAVWQDGMTEAVTTVRRAVRSPRRAP
jgi:hypothetical protein